MLRRTLLVTAAARMTATEGPIAVIAHRGDHAVHPENSLSAFRSAAEAGVDFVELDVRTTADGALVLQHDAALKGAGPVSAASLHEVRRLGLATFAQALKAIKGRCGVYVDSKAARAEAVIAAIEAEDMAQHAVFYSGLPVLEQIRRARPGWKVMPEAVNAEVLEKVIDELAPQVIAFDRRDFTDDLIRRAKRSGALVYVDRLGPDDRPEAWQDAVRRGADGIQTDRPRELIRMLRTMGRHP